MTICGKIEPENSCRRRNSHGFSSYDEIVSDYIERYRKKAEQLLRQFAEADLKKAIGIIACGKLPCGKQQHNHQRRMLKTARSLAKRYLLRVKEEIAHADSFENLYHVVRKAIGEVYGIGDLTIYDFAQRLGSLRQLEPKEVFLHSGAAEGAKCLGLKWKGKSVPVEVIPKAFHKLKPYEIEDCFCIYKNELKQLGRS